MYNKNSWRVAIAAIALPLVAVFTSCEKDPIDDPRPPIVASSSIVDSGSGNVTATNAAEGTTLTYESWVKVYQKFADGKESESKIPYIVKNTLKGVSGERISKSFSLDGYSVSTSLKAGETHKGGDYVTVKDSILVVTVSYENGFSFDYELTYQVPIYDDGKNKQVMPHYLYGEVMEEPGAVTNTGTPKTIDGVTYMVGKYQHVIAVEFAGKNHIVGAAIDLLVSVSGTGDGDGDIVSSHVTGLQIAPLTGSSGFLSKIDVRQTLSSGSTKEIVREVALTATGKNVQGTAIDANGMFNDFSRMGMGDFVNTNVEQLAGEEYITLSKFTDVLRIPYSFFTLEIPFTRMTAAYDDDVLQTDLLGYAYNSNRLEIVEESLDFIKVENGREYHAYYIKVKAQMGDAQNGWTEVVGSYTCNISFIY